MNEQRAMLAESVDRLFSELMADGMPVVNDSSIGQLWQSVEALGPTDVFLAEEAGGFGGCWQDACTVFHLLGLHALPLPVGETLIAKKLLQEASATVPAGATTVALCQDARLESSDTGEGLLFSGTLKDVPWGLLAGRILVVCDCDGHEQLVLLPSANASSVRQHKNEAEEPRDELVFESAPITAQYLLPGGVNSLRLYAALLRSAQISGALEAALKLTVEYVNQREQFGRPLSKFQALQQQLALLAEEAAAVKCAAMAASRCADLGDASFEIAAAKLRANRAVGKATSITHQSHGAIGFTREHHLHYWTQRLWSWRSEFGNDRYWSNRLGTLILREGADQFWHKLTARGDR
jgi:acyl-CoA dehydrogenase